ncbi:MAG TPA: 50S ribosomal protein L25, partial [Pyrinomonadaceae bacterium]|nr:50S ribosomal protein L25 [Pyrinomonadaceae bacterium]
MADKIVVKAEVREGRGKNDTRRLRREGKIPVSIYGGGGAAVAAVAELSDLAAILRSDSGVNTVFSLDVKGDGVSDVIFQDRQIDAVKGRLMHADLRRIAKGEKMELSVHLVIAGDAPGLLEAGAVLNTPLNEIKVLAEPANVPESITVDVSNLHAGETITVSDLSVPKNVEITEAADTVVASIVVVHEVVEE